MEQETTTVASEDNGGVQTINGVAVDDNGQAIPQPEESETAPAVEETTEPELSTETTTEASGVADNEPSEDEQLARFAQSKGLELDSENAKKAAKMAMNAERLMHQKSQQASQLEKATRITDEQVPEDASAQVQENIRMRNIELKLDIRDWKANNPEKMAHESAMIAVLADPIKKELVQNGYLSLDDVYNIAVGSNPNVEADLKSQGKKEALQNLAHKQQAAVPRGNAVNAVSTSEQITPQNVDAMVAKMSVEEYRQRLPEINKAMAG